MTIVHVLIDALFGGERIVINEVDRIIVREGERALVSVDGRYEGLYGPGEHLIRTRNHAFEVTGFAIAGGRAIDPRITALMRDRPELAEGMLMEVRTGPGEAAAIFRDGMLFEIMKPDARVVLWTDAGPWTVKRFDVTGELRVPQALAKRITTPRMVEPVRRVEVGREQIAVLYVDGVRADILGPGVHVFWSVGPKVEAKLIDTRCVTLAVPQQRFLTRDRVSIQIELSVVYRIADPVAAMTGERDFRETLCREAGDALRRLSGTMTLDRILGEKVDIDPDPVREAMVPLGVEVSELTMKDVVLPGEMSVIHGRVVAAENAAKRRTPYARGSMRRR